MRRSEKEIRDPVAIEAVIRAARVGRLALADGSQPYLVPLCFGYEEGVLYAHSAPEGRKLDLLRRNPKVCVAFDDGGELVPADEACRWTLRYRSVIAFGTAEIVEDADAKRRGLGVIMRQSSSASFVFSEQAVNRCVVIRVRIESMTGKQSGY